MSFRHAVELLQNDYLPLAASVAGVVPAKHSTVKKLSMPIAPDTEDAMLLIQVIELESTWCQRPRSIFAAFSMI